MKFLFSLLTLSLISMLSCSPGNGSNDKKNELQDLTQYVDPQIGSVHGRWFFYTPAARPFGMAKLAPHTNAYNSNGGWGPTGYDDRHESIEGFGHFHEFQIGGLVFMPTTGEILTTPGSLEAPDSGYRSRFEKSTEEAEAGYYQVLLKDYNVKVELSSTERVGYQRYTFPESSEANIIIDIGNKQGESSDVTEAFLELTDNNIIQGYIETYPEYAKFCDPGKRVKMYFVSELSKEPTKYGTFDSLGINANQSLSKGIKNGMYLSFSTNENEEILIRTGLSYTSIENAMKNLETEKAGNSFDEVRQESKEIWNTYLNKMVVKGGLAKDRTKFYTGLYHALLGRGIANDASGEYPLEDGKIGTTPLDANGQPKYRHINTDGMWGGFWNLSLVWGLAYPDYFSDYIQSNIDFYDDRGWLHDGAANGVYTNGVQTNFQGLLIASAYNIGIRDFDIEKAYAAALKNELEYRGRNLGNGKYDLHYFIKDGFVPYKDTTISNGWVFNFGASHTLEYAFSSYAVGQMAQSFGDTDSYEKLQKMGGYYKNLFDNETKFIRPRLEKGGFIPEFDELKPWNGFQEGNAYQFTWYVPHDVAGLVDLVGKPLFNERLETMFIDAQKSLFGGGSDEIHSFSGLEKLYNHGNQPCLHDSWLFNYSGKPWLTQKYTRAICNEFYGTEPLHGYGFGQDEDQGQLGAWYVMASMGLFDVQGHASNNPTFQFGSPLFEEVRISLDNEYYSGKELVIKTEHQSEENIYIQSASWNGVELEQCWIDRSTLMKGGELIFVMGSEANYEWGVSVPPPSMSTAGN